MGTERFFRPAYASQLVATWVPALDGVAAKLEAGGRVADIGCGHGASTIELAKAFPQATITGFDYHEASIVTARQRAAEAGIGDRVTFEVAGGDEFGPGGADDAYDLVCIFDALHDMGDPVGVARHIRSRLAPDGTWLLVEPLAGDRLEDNLHLLGRIFYSASTLICTPASRAQPVGACLGAQAGPGPVAGRDGSGRVHRLPPGRRQPDQPGARSPSVSGALAAARSHRRAAVRLRRYSS